MSSQWRWANPVVVITLALALLPLGHFPAGAAEADSQSVPPASESSLSVVEPATPATTSATTSATPAGEQPKGGEARLVAATEVLTSGKLTALNLSSVARTAYLVQKAKTRNGARSVGKLLAKENYGWTGKQWTCLDKLWIKESQWTYTSHNKRTGAHGIPQAYPATKYEYMGSDWRKNPVTQIMWGLRYIDIRYGSPCRALNTFYRIKMY